MHVFLVSSWTRYNGPYINQELDYQCKISMRLTLMRSIGPNQLFPCRNGRFSFHLIAYSFQQGCFLFVFYFML